mgnify:FL=1
MKRIITVTILLIFLLTACGSGYDNASVDIPSTWAAYSIDTLSFRFEAGYQSESWDALQTDMDTRVSVLGTSNQLALFGRLISPASAKGTVNYIDFGYWDTGRALEPTELEGIMETLNNLSSPLLQLSVSSSQLQSSRIRTYGAVTALTTAFTVETEDLSCVLQVALVPHGSRVYLISYADFSTGADNDMLEGLLSTLQFSEGV